MLKSLIDEPGLKDLSEIAYSAPEGDFLEVGVYKGGSAWVLDKICQERGCKLHLFDTFMGMPFSDDIDVHPVGMYSDVQYRDVRIALPNAKIYQGVFPHTLPDDLDNIAFAHVDCDQYRSIRAAASRLPDRIVPGGIIYFDDYANIPGAKKAADILENLSIVSHRAIWRKGG